MLDKKQCENTHTHSRRGQEKVLENRTPGALKIRSSSTDQQQERLSRH